MIFENLRSFIQYVRKIFRKSTISYPLMRIRTSAFQRINVKFLGKICVRTKWIISLYYVYCDAVLLIQPWCEHIYSSLEIVTLLKQLGSNKRFQFLIKTLIKYFLTHFMPLVSFYTPWKYRKTFSFLMLSGGEETGQ